MLDLDDLQLTDGYTVYWWIWFGCWSRESNDCVFLGVFCIKS